MESHNLGAQHPIFSQVSWKWVCNLDILSWARILSHRRQLTAYQATSETHDPGVNQIAPIQWWSWVIVQLLNGLNHGSQISEMDSIGWNKDYARQVLLIVNLFVVKRAICWQDLRIENHANDRDTFQIRIDLETLAASSIRWSLFVSVKQDLTILDCRWPCSTLDLLFELRDSAPTIQSIVRIETMFEQLWSLRFNAHAIGKQYKTCEKA